MPQRRLPAASLCLGVVLGGILAAPALAGAATATTTTGAPATTTPTTSNTSLVAASLKAAGQQMSVHFVATSSASGRMVKITGSSSATTGTQQIVLHANKATGHVTGRLVDKIVYFRGDTFGLEEYLGMPATLAPKYTGKWIFFSPATKDYGPIEKSMTLAAALSQVTLKGPYTSTTSTVNGQSATSVTGKTSAFSAKGKTGKATLDIASTGQPLPIRYTGKGKSKNSTESGTVVFSQWGHTVAPKTPQGAVAASSITSSG